MDQQTLDKTFKNYDVRGLVGDQIDEEYAYAIGNAFATHLGITGCVVGRDGRRDSKRFQDALMEGLRDAGCDVEDIGLVSTPQIKWVVAEHDKPAGIMVTASHNPPTYNGFKFVGKGGLAIGEGAGLHDIKPLMLRDPVKKERGALTQHNYLEEFVGFTLDATIDSSDREVFIDCSGGVFSEEIKKAMDLGSFRFTLYNCELDPEFRMHPPNPLEPEAMEAAQEYCGINGCIGVVFDADGDRSIFVDEDGHDVPGDYFGAFVAQRTFAEGDGATSTVRDSRAVRDIVESRGGRFALGKVGHANIQRLMVENDLRLGTEKSGHVFFKESHSAENGLMGLLLILAHLDEEETLADGIKEFREQYLSSPEINFRVGDREEVIHAVEEHYDGRGDINTMDGVLIEGDDWWVNIRPSNTEPLVRLTFEARDKRTYDDLKQEAEELLGRYTQE